MSGCESTKLPKRCAALCLELAKADVHLTGNRPWDLTAYYSRLMLRQVIALQPRRDDVLLLSRQFSERLAGNLSQINDLVVLLRLFCLSEQ